MKKNGFMLRPGGNQKEVRNKPGPYQEDEYAHKRF
jgi:hypothetical protein